MKTLKHSNQTQKRILIFGTLMAVLLALTCSSSWPTKAQDSMDEEMDDEMSMDMLQVFRPFATAEDLVRSLPLADQLLIRAGQLTMLVGKLMTSHSPKRLWSTTSIIPES